VLLVGASGELPANPRHAALLARRLLEYKVSAVVDLYELKLAERRRFVKLFLESLILDQRQLDLLDNRCRRSGYRGHLA
jgi:hypothetical protein